jgi:hypothetical protein
MITIAGDASKAMELVTWFDANSNRNSRPGLNSSYGSFMDGVVRWDATDRSWYVSCYPRENKIEFECKPQFEPTVMSKFG